MHWRVLGLANQPFHRRIGMPARIGADDAPGDDRVRAPSWTVSTDRAELGWPRPGLIVRRPRIPDAGRPVDAARGEALAIGAEGHAEDAGGMAAEGEDLLARDRVPELDR